MKETQLIEKLKGNNEQAFKLLYKYFPKIRSYLLKFGASKQEAEDIYHDALYILINKLNDPGFILTSSVNTFLFGICKHKYISLHREKKKNIDLDFKGKEVCALVTGGGYAEYVKTTLATVLPVPKGLNVVDAAAIPETFFTVWTNLFDSGSLKKNETLLIHGGASGIGITAALIAKAMGIKFLTTVGSVKKKKFMEQLGSTLTINYQNEDFEEVIKKELKGVDVILDIVGGEYFQKNINILNKFGRLINIAYLQGPIVKANLLPIMLKRLIVTGSTLRIRSDEEKQNIRDSIKTYIWPLFENETINMIIDKEFGFYDVKKAMNIWKITKI